MRGINLARRPFVNRRPVLRLAGLLWLVGIALLILNVRLFSGHWTGTAVNRQRLIEANREIGTLNDQIRALDQQLARVNIRRQNRQTEGLNSLIDYRTFPWSALFDDLEEVVPLDVRLTSVRPIVKLKEPEKRRPGPTDRRRTSSAGSEPSGEPDDDAEGETPLHRNEVKLQLGVVAKSEEALMELIDALYLNPSFRAPFLPGEVLNLDSGSSSASVSVLYLTRPTRPGDESEDGAAPTPPEAAPPLEATPGPEPPGETEEAKVAATGRRAA